MGKQAGELQVKDADRQEQSQQPGHSGQREFDPGVQVSRPISKPRSVLRLPKASLLNNSLVGPLQLFILLCVIGLSLALGALGLALFKPSIILPDWLSVEEFLVLATVLLVVILLFIASMRLALDRKVIKRLNHLTDRIDHLGQGDVVSSLPPGPDDEIGRAVTALNQLSDFWSQRHIEVQEQSLAFRREASELRHAEAALRQQNDELKQRLEKDRSELEGEVRRCKQAEANLRSNLNTMVLLYHVITVTTSTLDPQKALETLCRELAVTLNLPQAAYAELSADRESLTVITEYRREDRPSALGMVIPVKGNPATAQVLQTRQPLVLKNAQSDPRQEVIQHLERQRGTVSLLIVPIIVRGEVTGTLGLDALEEREFSQDDISLALNCATGLAQALDYLHLYHALQKELAEKQQVELDLRESEARYRQYVENSPNPIFIVDRFGSIQTWSRTCERVFKQGQEVLGLDFAALLAEPLDREKLGALVRQVFDLRRAANDVDILYRCKDGTTRYMVARLYPLTDRDGGVSGCVFANTDLTERKRAEDEIRRRTLQLEVLRKAALELTAELDLEALLSRVADRSRELLGADNSGIYLYDPETDTLELRVRSGESSPPFGLALRRGEGLAGRVLETHNPLMVEDYSGWDGRSNQKNSLLIGAMIGVPVSWRDEMLGVLSVSSTTSYRFTRSDIELLGLFAHQAAIAIRNARIMKEEDRQRRRAEAMARAAADLSGTLEMQPLLDNAVQSASTAFPQADFGMILLHPLSGESSLSLPGAALPPFAVFGTDLQKVEPVEWTAERLAEIEAIWKRVFQDGRPILAPDMQRIGGIENGFLSCLQSGIGAPLKLRDQVTGILWFGSSKMRGAFLNEDISLLEALANQTSIAVMNAELYRQARISEDTQRHEALHDPLTGLPNRNFFQDRLRVSIERTRKSNRQTASLQTGEPSTGQLQAAVLFLDLDRFKIVNDSLGHAAGDRLLVEVGRRLSSSLRPGDTVARFGGDEFAVLLENLKTTDEAAQTAALILAEIARPITVNHHNVSTTASIGIALTNGMKRNAEEMLREADIAMYHAKANGKARYEFYQPQMGLETVSALELESDLRRALSEQELCLVYQPVVDLNTGKCVEMEELLRWNHPKRGLLLPEEFLPVAVETGLMGQIGKWVVQQAIRQQKEWSTTGKPVPVVINVPARQLENEAMLNQVEAIFEEEALLPGSLALDVGEPAGDQDCERLEMILGRMRKSGVWINLEHFGSSDSSLSTLKRLPLDGIKIPRGLVADLPGSPRDIAVVEALIQMGHALGLVVTAVGVETEEQADCLRSLGCDWAQGRWANGS